MIYECYSSTCLNKACKFIFFNLFILSKDFVFHILNEFKLMSNILKTFQILKLKVFYLKEKLTLCVAFKTSNLKADLLKLFQYNPLKRTSVLHLKDFYKLVSLNSM